MSDHATQSNPVPKPKKVFSLTRSAIKTIAVGIEAECKKEGKTVPQGREMLKNAVGRYRSSIDNGHDNHLGTAEPLT